MSSADIAAGQVWDRPLQRIGGERVAPITEDVADAGATARGDLLELGPEDELVAVRAR
jgi:hypothetical protein